ncbi:hypothetical protein H0H87_006287 [Tephrocybe sp. NHM501043]|nr:hypothetical protein H0H87_006287 [Tephrocybe sp. NHM501043]
MDTGACVCDLCTTGTLVRNLGDRDDGVDAILFDGWKISRHESMGDRGDHSLFLDDWLDDVVHTMMLAFVNVLASVDDNAFVITLFLNDDDRVQVLQEADIKRAEQGVLVLANSSAPFLGFIR